LARIFVNRQSMTAGYWLGPVQDDVLSQLIWDISVVMDKITRDATGIPGFVLSEPYMLVVPPGDKHDEDSVFKEAYTLKKQLSKGVLSHAQERAFRECTMIIVVLDEDRHARKKMQDNRKWMLTDIFKFYKERGKSNINVLYKEKGQTGHKKGEVWGFSATHFTAWLGFLGSPLAMAPAGEMLLRSFVRDSLAEMQLEVTSVKEVAAASKPVYHDRDIQCKIQCDLGAGSVVVQGECSCRFLKEKSGSITSAVLYLQAGMSETKGSLATVCSTACNEKTQKRPGATGGGIAKKAKT
jgi:hypothetical protein